MDIIPKFSDVKHLSDLAKVFALPMLAVFSIQILEIWKLGRIAF